MKLLSRIRVIETLTCILISRWVSQTRMNLTSPDANRVPVCCSQPTTRPEPLPATGSAFKSTKEFLRFSLLWKIYNLGRWNVALPRPSERITAVKRRACATGSILAGRAQISRATAITEKQHNVYVNLLNDSKENENENSRLLVPKDYLITDYLLIYHFVLYFINNFIWFPNSATYSLVWLFLRQLAIPLTVVGLRKNRESEPKKTLLRCSLFIS